MRHRHRTNPPHRRPAGLIVLAVLLLLNGPVFGQLDRAAFERDTNALAARNRSVGSAGYDAAVDYVRQQILALPGVELQEHAYPVMTPHTRSATLTLADGESLDVFPYFPAGVRLNATPAEGLTGELVYCGRGEYGQIPAARVAGSIAVMEADIGDEWKAVAYFDPKAIVFLGGDALTHNRMRGSEIGIPINVPRFYLPDGPLSAALRGGTAGRATVKADVDWQRSTARNLYAFVAAKNAPPPRGKPWAAMTVVVPLDATGFVPDCGVAAGQAVQPATALALLRDFARDPPKRPVLVCFTGADSYNLIGTRQMLLALADAPAKWRDTLRTDVVPRISGVEADLAAAEAAHGDPARLNATTARGFLDRVVKVIETDITLEQDELFRLRVLPPDQLTGPLRAKADALQDRQIRLNQLRYAFASAPQQLADFGDEAKAYVRRTLERLGGLDAEGLRQQLAARRAELDRRIGLYEWLASRLARRADPSPRGNADRLIEVMIGLDLSDRGVRVGPAFWGRTFGVASNQVQEYREWFERVASRSKPDAAWFAPLANVIEFEPFKATRSQLSYLTAPLGLPTELGMGWGVPGLTLATLEDARSRRDTPADTLAALDLNAVYPQADAVVTLVRHAFDDPTFLGQPEYRRNTNDFVGQVVSTAAGLPIPDLPRGGFLATYYYLAATRKIPPVKTMPYAAGVRRLEVHDCDAEGRYVFEGLPRLSDLKQLLTKVYRIEPGSGAITAGTDLGKQSGDLSPIVSLDQSITPVKSVVFDCREFTLGGLYDPRFLQGLGEVQIIDARRNAEPQRFDLLTQGQMMSGLFEPGSRSQLLFRYGRIGNRILLLNLPEAVDGKPAAQGFTPEQFNGLGPLNLATARDFWRLNDERIAQYRKAGVTSGLIDSMHANAAAKLTTAAAAYAASDTPALMKDANRAWADEARVYDAAQRMANDVIYAAIFLLLLAVPFSFCMERLLIATANVYRQIAGSAAIFVLMAAALWLFHPAFKISASPLIIILAFAIILMSIVVIGVVYQKFDSELKRLRSGRGTAAATSIASASVLISAIMLGIANMRRRKFRTVLTATTVVLITFAVLCFTSTSRYQGTLSLPTGIDSQYPGLLLRQRGFRILPREAIEGLHAAYPGERFVERWWTLNPSDTKDVVNVIAENGAAGPARPRVIALQALLGLTPGESTVSAVRDVVPNFDRLEHGENDLIYLSLASAGQLGVKTGDRVRVAGRSLEVAGLYDAGQFDQRVTMLSGEPLAPLKYSAGALDASGRKLTEFTGDALDLDADASAAEAASAYEHLPATQFAVVSAAVNKAMENTTLRTVAVRLAADDAKPADRDAAVKKVVDDLTQRFALATFAGTSEGVKLVSAGNLSSIGGGSNVIIPLAIAKSSWKFST